MKRAKECIDFTLSARYGGALPVELAVIRRVAGSVNPAKHALLAESGIDCRIQRRIVVHFQLAVEPEAPLPCEYLLPEPCKRVGQIVSLFAQDGQALAIAFAVSGRSLRA